MKGLFDLSTQNWYYDFHRVMLEIPLDVMVQKLSKDLVPVLYATAEWVLDKQKL